MKKFTLILSAMLVAFSLNAQFMKSVDSKLTNLDGAKMTVAKKTFNPTILSAGPIVKTGATASMRKAPASTEASYLAKLGMQTGMGEATFMWMATIDSTDTWQGKYFAMELCGLVNDTTISEDLAYFNVPAYAIGDTASGIFQFSTLNLLYYGAKYGDPDAIAAFVNNKYYLNPGKYVVFITGNNGSQALDSGIYIVFEIISYDVTGYNVVLNSDSTKATISWNELELPSNYYYGVEISCGATTIYSNIATLTTDSVDTVHSPFTFDIEKGKTYNVLVNVYENYQGKLYLGCDEWVDEAFTVGTDPKIPTDLKVVVNDSTQTATFSWTNTTTYCILQLMDAEGNYYGFKDANALGSGSYYTNKKTATSVQLPVGMYIWSVNAEEVSGNTLYPYGDPVIGAAFMINDVFAPEIAKVSVDSLAPDAAHLVITVSDNATAAADLLFSIAGDITVNDTILPDGTILFKGLTENKKYSITITAKDEAGNVSDAYAVEFVPTDDQEAPTNFQASIKSVADKYAVINVSAQDNKATAEQLVYLISINGGDAAEFKAEGDSIVLEGLTPETEYSLALKVRDIAGNVADTTINLTFTTTQIIPIEVVMKFAEANGYYYNTYGVWEVYLYNVQADGKTLPMAYFAISPDKQYKLSGTYSISGKSMRMASIIPSVDAEEISATDAAIKLDLITFVPDTAADGTITVYGAYSIQFQILGKDGNLYVGQLANVVSTYVYNKQAGVDKEVSVIDEPLFPTPQLTKAEVVEGTLTDTSVTINLDASDALTAITDLKVFITTDKVGTPFDEKSDINGGEGYRLDADGNLTLEGLEAEKKYTLRFELVNPFGKSCYESVLADRVSVTFTTLKTGLEDLLIKGQAVKVIENGQIYILRGDKKYTVLGAEIAK